MPKRLTLSQRDRRSTNYRFLRARINAGARRYMAAPWKIERLINGVAPEPGQDIGSWAKEALAAEKRKWRGKHWSYDFARHVGLLQVWAGAMQMQATDRRAA